MKKEDKITLVAFIIMIVCSFMLYYVVREIGL